MKRLIACVGLLLCLTGCEALQALDAFRNVAGLATDAAK